MAHAEVEQKGKSLTQDLTHANMLQIGDWASLSDGSA